MVRELFHHVTPVNPDPFHTLYSHQPTRFSLPFRWHGRTQHPVSPGDEKGHDMKKILMSVLLAASFAAPLAANAQFSISVNVAPPPLPVYVQPPIPGDGYMWTPGYWAWDPDAADYYWVPGTWVQA